MKPWIAAFLAACAVCVRAQDFGPIDTRNHRDLSLPFLRMSAVSNILRAGDSTFSFGWTEANDFRLLPEGGPYTVHEDEETSRFSLEYKRGLGHDQQLSVELPILIRGGGFMDSIIEWWHKRILRWEDPLRFATPEDLCIVDVPGAHFGSAWGQGDVSCMYSKRVSDRLITSAALKLPTGNASELMGSGAPDFGISADYETPIGPHWTYYLQGGLILQGTATVLPNSRVVVHQEMMAIVYKQNSRDAWIGQWNGEASATVTGVAGSDSTHRLITVGYQRKLSRTRFLEMYISEDRDLFENEFPEGANIGPDFTAGVRLTMKL
jgi:hypothetical protein